MASELYHDKPLFKPRRRIGLPMPRILRLLGLATVVLIIWLILQIFQGPAAPAEEEKKEDMTNWVTPRDPNLDRMLLPRTLLKLYTDTRQLLESRQSHYGAPEAMTMLQTIQNPSASTQQSFP